jgi:hypothetical protein
MDVSKLQISFSQTELGLNFLDCVLSFISVVWGSTGSVRCDFTSNGNITWRYRIASDHFTIASSETLLTDFGDLLPVKE